MNREDIIRMAREAGVYSGANETVFAASLERFAALVAAAAIKDAPDYKMGYADGVAAEREACARIAERSESALHCAFNIRARGQL